MSAAADTAGTPPIPERALRIVSTATPETLEIAVVEAPVAKPGPGEVVVRIDAAPIHPSDQMVLLGAAELADARFGGAPDRPRVEISLSPAARRAMGHRMGIALPVGQEGAGVVVAAGSGATSLIGRKVAVLSSGPGGMRGTYAEYLTVAADDCTPLPDTVPTVDAAAMFINPLTALAIVKTLRLEGHTALIHTAAASSLGQMLVKICRADGVPLVNVVRRAEQADLLTSLGARYVCNSSAASFGDDLVAAIKETGATVAFDAIGGGTMPGELLLAMEAVARLKKPGPYGSFDDKHVYIYGHLDNSPTVLAHHDYGLLWGVSSWLMPDVLARIGRERTDALHQRILNELDTTFKTAYAQSITLSQALQPAVMNGYCRQATGAKYLITPNIPSQNVSEPGRGTH
ncbi:hypothetical protein BST20_23325 [Mycobacterium branderi]|nr:zinc-binding dehydrogenase [Mycobacterium branderi]ORA33183.1 hypothetical protein BST20_23325 [Mycobacterium branderi]